MIYDVKKVFAILEAVIMMLPPLSSLPLEEFIFCMAAEACFTARKQLPLRNHGY